MVTTHKRTAFLYLVGLNKNEETTHSMMESCASFDTLVLPSMEVSSEEKPARKTITNRMSRFKKKSSTAPTKKQESLSDNEATPSLLLESSHQATAKVRHNKPNGKERSKSKSPAARRWTADTENDSDLDSSESDTEDVEDATNDGVAVVSAEQKVVAKSNNSSSFADSSTRRTRRSFFNAFSLHKTTEQQTSIDESQSSRVHRSISSRWMGNRILDSKADQLNKEPSKTQQRPIAQQAETRNLESEAVRLNDKQSSKLRASSIAKLVGRKNLEGNADQSRENQNTKSYDNQGANLNRSKELDPDSFQLDESRSSTQYGSQISKMNLSKEVDESRSFEVTSNQSYALNDSHESDLNESQRSLTNVDASGSDLDARGSPKRSPRARKRSDSDGPNRTRRTCKDNHVLSDSRKTRRSLSPRRRLKQDDQAQIEGCASAEVGHTSFESRKERGVSPRQKIAPLHNNSNVDLPSRVSAISRGGDTENKTRRMALHPDHRRHVSESNKSEMYESIQRDDDNNNKVFKAHKSTETSPRKNSDDKYGCESDKHEESDFHENRGRQHSDKSPRRSRSVSAVLRTRHALKSRDESVNTRKLREENIGGSGSEERRSDRVNRIKELRSKLDQCHSEKGHRSSARSVGPDTELSLKNLLEADSPMVDRKCLTVVSPKELEKKKIRSLRNDEAITLGERLPSPLTPSERHKLAHRISPKKSPSSQHRSTSNLEPLRALAKKTPSSSVSLSKAQEVSKMTPKKSPSSSNRDQFRRIKETEAENSFDQDARGRARSRIEQLKRDSHSSQRTRSRSSSRNRKVDNNDSSGKKQTFEKKLSESPNKFHSSLNQRQLKSPERSFEKVRPFTPGKLSIASSTVNNDSKTEWTPDKSKRQPSIERYANIQSLSKVSPKTISSSLIEKAVTLESHDSVSIPLRTERKHGGRRRRSPSKSPGREISQVHGQRNGKNGQSDPARISKRNEHFIRKAISARDLDGHQYHDFEVEEKTNSGNVVKRKLRVVPASDVENLSSMLLQKHLSRGGTKRRNGSTCPIAAQLHIPDMDESQKSNLKVEYTEYNEISLLDKSVDANEASDGDVQV